MKRISILLSIFVTTAPVWLVPEPSFASPIAKWVTPWQVTLGFKTEAGNAFDQRAFGGGTDGQTINLGAFGELLAGTPAIAQSESSVTTAYLSDSVAQTGLKFFRDFSLTGSPTGWTVTLNSTLDGKLSAATLDYHPFANVSALIDVVGVSALVETYGYSIDATKSDPAGVSIAKSQSLSTTLPDGVYRAEGQLLTTAQIDEGFFAGSAGSDFFHTFSGSVQASAIPEPGSLSLIGIGALLILAGIWRRSHAARL